MLDLRTLAPLSVGQAPGRVRAEWTSLGIAERLAPFDPVVVSSLASALHTAESDLDVVVDTRPGGFAAAARSEYGGRPGFTTWVDGPRTLVAFDGPSLHVELCGEPRPVDEHSAYRHAVVHRRLVELGGPGFAAIVRAVRARHRLKTEPALAHVLRLQGDPYAAIDALVDASETRLRRLVTRSIR